MKFWYTLKDRLETDGDTVLLYVLESKDSSPGRQGFKMLVGSEEWIHGSIGGGFMEHKLVELARSLLLKPHNKPFFKRQIHRTDEGANRSGMICSGEQIVAFYHLTKEDIPLFETLKFKKSKDLSQLSLVLTQEKLSFTLDNEANQAIQCKILSDNEWELIEQINAQERVYIIGAGHVGLALSQLMSLLDYHITIIDDRNELNTMVENSYVHEKLIIDYNEIAKHVPSDPNSYVALMSFGYRSDKLIISKLLDHEFFYFGVLGSQAKMIRLLAELKEEGFSDQQLKKLHTPIGIQIKSKTPMEIAVSIAAEMINLKNNTIHL